MSAIARDVIPLPPRASSLVESLRDVGYSLRTAIADVIDNSITAGARNIHLFADTHTNTPTIGILDDGCGMTPSELVEAMRPGSKSPLATRSVDDLGRFGLGLKTASFSQCRRLTVLTRKSGTTTCAKWDLDTVAARDEWVIEVPRDASSVRWYDQLPSEGTLVVWEKLDRVTGVAEAIRHTDFVRQLDEAASHIEFVFHRYLLGREGPKISISLNGTPLSPFDPFHSTHPATQHHSEEYIRLDGKEIRIWPVTLPHHDKVSEAEWQKYARQEGYVRNQGFYLYRNRRLIVHGTWFRLARQLELTKLTRVGIDIPNNLDADWKIDIRKANAQPPPAVRDRLRRIIENMGIPSRRTYTSRGAKLTDESRMPVWLRIQDKNRISYEINEGHPIVADYIEGLDDERARHFERVILLIQRGLPVATLHADVSATPEVVRQLPIPLDDLQLIVHTTWSILKRKGLSSKAITKWMQSAEPFQSDWTRTVSLVEKLEKDDI